MVRPSKLDNSSRINRRKFLIGSAALAVSYTFSNIIHANTGLSSERTLEFVNLHTDETLHCCYWANGNYDPSSLSKINYILRDHRANEVYEMDSNLMDLLHILHKTTESRAPFYVISGYRSPQTNQELQQQGSGVAKRSLHMRGQAIDIRLPDVELSYLRDAAIALEAGGVGYYAESNFIHIDTGKFRTW